MGIKLKTIRIEKLTALNIIIGQAHFIKTVEDVHELLVTSIPGIKFGLAFCEASGKRLVRTSGTDKRLIGIAQRNALRVGAGHSFFLVLADCYPINILPRLKLVPEICSIFCATSNPVELIVAESKAGRGILGVVDGGLPLGVEKKEDQLERKIFLRTIGYKF